MRQFITTSELWMGITSSSQAKSIQDGSFFCFVMSVRSFMWKMWASVHVREHEHVLSSLLYAEEISPYKAFVFRSAFIIEHLLIICKYSEGRTLYSSGLIVWLFSVNIWKMQIKFLPQGSPCLKKGGRKSFLKCWDDASGLKRTFEEISYCAVKHQVPELY